MKIGFFMIGLRCTPFDPLVDTESLNQDFDCEVTHFVAPPSIRLWILKVFVSFRL